MTFTAQSLESTTLIFWSRELRGSEPTRPISIASIQFLFVNSRFCYRFFQRGPHDPGLSAFALRFTWSPCDLVLQRTCTS